MDEIETYTRNVASSLVGNIVTTFDPETRINHMKEYCSSPLDLLRLARVSHSARQLEKFEKEPCILAEKDADLFPSHNVLESKNELSSDESSDEPEEGRDTCGSQGSNQQLEQQITSPKIKIESRKSEVKMPVMVSKGESPSKGQISNQTSPAIFHKHRDRKEEISESDLFFYSKISKEGTLQKKCANFFLGWQGRYVVIQNYKLMYAKSQSAFLSKKRIRCINFLTQKCLVTEVNDYKFRSIEVSGTKRRLVFKAESKEEAFDWVGRLTKMMNYIDVQENCCHTYPLISGKKPWKMDSISRQEFYETAQSGDILLFQTENFFAKVQRKLTGSEYDHVAILFKLDNRLYFFEATGDSGVTMTNWDEFIMRNWKRFYTKIAVRHLIHDKPAEEFYEKIYNFIVDTSGAHYRLNMTKIFKRNSISARNAEDKTARKEEGYFCSELVAAGYKRLGLLDERKACSQYWPANFSAKKKLKLLGGAKLSNEIQIMFEK